ncbi:MAG: IS1595 family transposase [Rhodobacteraceae bacterium]|nr:IS1595 family transposase [Paracoccaceae bacterium]MYJ87264.1 IS1595 family transposase [Paracoccaceae bacterium]
MGDFNMEGTVEVDETYIGGKRKNMPNSKRKELTGRDAVGKTAIVGIKNSETNKVTAKVVKSTDKETLQGFVEDNTTKETTVYTDEAKAYKGMNRPHESVKHSVSQYVNGMSHTNGIESYWSLLKKGFHGTFHHFSPSTWTGMYMNSPLDITFVVRIRLS